MINESEALEPADNDTAPYRVAYLHSDGGDLIERVSNAGFEVSYFYDAAYGTEDVDFDRIPPFSFVIADLQGEQRQTLELALMFVRARQPRAFLLVVPSDEGGLPLPVIRRVQQVNYETKAEVVGDRAYVEGVAPGSGFVWPASIVPDAG